MELRLKKQKVRNFANPDDQVAYVLEAHNAIDLMHKELDINLAEQNILSDRILTMKNFINDLPENDLKHSALLTQIQMDQIELDEIKRRERILVDELNKQASKKK